MYRCDQYLPTCSPALFLLLLLHPCGTRRTAVGMQRSRSTHPSRHGLHDTRKPDDAVNTSPMKWPVRQPRTRVQTLTRSSRNSRMTFRKQWHCGTSLPGAVRRTPQTTYQSPSPSSGASFALEIRLVGESSPHDICVWTLGKRYAAFVASARIVFSGSIYFLSLIIHRTPSSVGRNDWPMPYSTSSTH